MENTVLETKTNLINTINNLFDNLEDFSKNLDTKYEEMNEIKGDIDQKHKDIHAFKKVSFITNLSKQLQNKDSQIDFLEKRISKLTAKNEKLLNQLNLIKSNPDSLSIILDSEDKINLEEDKINLEEDNIWEIKELDGIEYLFNSETNKIHEMLKNENPGNIIGRITSKNKFKKYNEPKEYC
jgi:hypothetical protein